MEKILTFTNGQHILFGMILSHITNNLNLVFPKSNYGGLCEFIIEIDSPEDSNYELTYSESMEEYPENLYDIFQGVWEKYEDVFLALQKG